MTRMKIFFTAGLLIVSSMVFAFVDEGGGGRFCKNNPTMNTGTCINYASGGVVECNTVVTATKDCYGIGAD